MEDKCYYTGKDNRSGEVLRFLLAHYMHGSFFWPINSNGRTHMNTLNDL